MPSGAKKRKAAKKKKVQQISLNNPNSSAQSHGNVDSGPSVALEKSSTEGVSSGENVQNVAIEKGSNESKEVHTGGSSVKSSSSCSSNSSRSSSDDESYVKKNSVVVETRIDVDSVKPVNTLFEVADAKVPAGGNSKATAETAFVVDPDKGSLVEEVAQVNGSASSDYPVISSLDYELKVRGDADKVLVSYDNSSGITSNVMDFGSRKKEDGTVLTSEEKVAIYMDVKNSATAGKDELLLSHNAPNVHISNAADHMKGSESPECSDNQHLEVSAPQVVQKTSFKSCCGIFELFNSSDR